MEHTTAVPVVGDSNLDPPTHTGEAEGAPVSRVPTRKLNVGGPPARPPRPTGAARIGRATDNDIVIHDVLASRHHAYLAPTPLDE